MKKCFLWFVFCLATFTIGAVEKGTLIVSYKTGMQGERLDRVRFWLKDKNSHQQMYPKGNGFVEEKEDLTRMVVIDDLQPGTYTLEFLVPNKDSFFENVQPRHVTISGGDVIRIDQIIHPKKQEVAFVLPTIIEEIKKKTGSLIVTYHTGESRHHLDNVQFRLIDAEGEEQIHPKENEIFDNPLTNGYLVMVDALPVGEYRLEFFSKETLLPYDVKSPIVTVKEGETESIQTSIPINSSHL